MFFSRRIGGGGVTYFDIHLVVEEDVPQFQISVDDPVVMEILAPLEQLHHVVAGLWLRDGLTPLMELQERLKQNTLFVFIFRPDVLACRRLGEGELGTLFQS